MTAPIVLNGDDVNRRMSLMGLMADVYAGLWAEQRPYHRLMTLEPVNSVETEEGPALLVPFFDRYEGDLIAHARFELALESSGLAGTPVHVSFEGRPGCGLSARETHDMMSCVTALVMCSELYGWTEQVYPLVACQLGTAFKNAARADGDWRNLSEGA